MFISWIDFGAEQPYAPYICWMRFNIRVYGLLIEDGKVLVSDELIKGKGITKFPGGGLEFGEGTIEALKREFREELDTEIHIRRHYYTTDFYVPAPLPC